MMRHPRSGSTVHTPSPSRVCTAALLAALSGCTTLPDPPSAPGSSPPTEGESITEDADSGISEERSGVDDDDSSDDSGADDTNTDAGPEDCGIDFGEDTPSNVLLISIDTLRRDDIGRYSGGDTTPRLDALLETSLVLDSHASCSNWTYPAMTCLLTGSDNSLQGFMPLAVEPLPDSHRMLAEVLADGGYQTTTVAAQGYFAPNINLTQGYSTVEANQQWTAPEVVDLGLEYAARLEANNAPWLLHLHFFDPHIPYLADPSYRRGEEELAEAPFDLTTVEGTDALQANYDVLTAADQALVRAHIDMLYQADLRLVDESIGHLLDELRATGALEDTLVVLVSDHGEQFFEHGEFEHGNALYGEETRALAAFWSESITPGVVTQRTTHADVMPTVLQILDIPAPETVRGAAVGLAPSARPTYTEAYIETPELLRISQSVTLNDDRLIYWWDGRVEQYDLAADYGEQSDRYDPTTPTTQRLLEALQPRIDAMQRALPQHDPAPTDAF